MFLNCKIRHVRPDFKNYLFRGRDTIYVSLVGTASEIVGSCKSCRSAIIKGVRVVVMVVVMVLVEVVVVVVVVVMVVVMVAGVAVVSGMVLVVVGYW